MERSNVQSRNLCDFGSASAEIDRLIGAQNAMNSWCSQQVSDQEGPSTDDQAHRWKYISVKSSISFVASADASSKSVV